MNTPMTEDMRKRVLQFIQIRDKLRELEDAHKQKCKPLRDLQELVGARIQQFLSDHKLENLRTEAGTCYISTRHTASLADPEAFMTYVIDNKLYDLLDRRANSTAVKAFVEKHNALPPGCNLNAFETVGVRRAGAPEAESK